MSNKLKSNYFRQWKDSRYKNRNFLIKKICINKDQSIKEAIINLNKSALQIVIVLNKQKKYLGVITDGDIRRGFIRKISLDKSVEKILRKKSTTVTPNTSRESVKRIMEDKKILHLPIVNSKGIFQGLHLSDDVISNIKNQNLVIIMAGGYGKRLRPLTLKMPKPMLNYKNKPILEHIIKNFNSEGFVNFYITIGYLANKIKNYFKDGSDVGVNIKYIKEKKPLGTAGSLAFVVNKINKPIIVCNGDLLHKINIQEMLNFHNKKKAFATMAVRDHKVDNPFGVVNTIGSRINGFKEKPVKRYYVNAGIYIFNPKILKYLKKNIKIDMPELFKILIKKRKKALIFPAYENWTDIGTYAEFKKINKTSNNF